MNDASPEGRGVMRVRTELVLDQLVSRVLGRALELRPQQLDPESERVLDGAPEPKALARIGYTSRVAETELFEAAREPMPWLVELLKERTTNPPSRDQAIEDLCWELAAGEPETKPDLGEGSWRVPGPGGHVRHFLALAATEELSHGEDNREPELKRELSAGEAKRCFLVGFYARCCEEAADATSS